MPNILIFDLRKNNVYNIGVTHGMRYEFNNDVNKLP